MEYKKTKEAILVKIRRGEKMVEAIRDLCDKERIKNGWFEGIGALDWVELAHYSVVNKKYSSFVMEEPLEMISIMGNVFLGEDGKIIVHAHVSVSRPDGETKAGHLVEARIGGAGEMIFWPTESKLVKKLDEETGLKILEI